MAAGKSSILLLISVFVAGAVISSAIVHKSASSKQNELQAALDDAHASETSLKQQVESLEKDRSRADKVATTDAVPTAEIADPDKAKAMELLRKSLKDPASAVFGDIKIAVGQHGKIACGLVNARNGFGGFTGMKRFVVDFEGVNSGDSHAIAVDDAFVDLAWMTSCNS